MAPEPGPVLTSGLPLTASPWFRPSALSSGLGLAAEPLAPQRPDLLPVPLVQLGEGGRVDRPVGRRGPPAGRQWRGLEAGPWAGGGGGAGGGGAWRRKLRQEGSVPEGVRTPWLNLLGEGGPGSPYIRVPGKELELQNSRV